MSLMKIICFCHLFFLLNLSSTIVDAQDLKLMTYNMRLDLSVDGENAWSKRQHFFVNQLVELSPDIFGTQEGLPHQIDFIDDKLGHYAFIGIGRDGVEKRGEYCAIFYKTEKVLLLKSNTF